MLIKVRSLDENGNTSLYHQLEINGEAFSDFVKSREKETKEKGAEWAMGGITVFAKEILKLVKSQGSERDIEMEFTNLTMMAWLIDSIWGGISYKKLLKCNFDFVVHPDGTVIYNREEK
ncbi:hypothetical protein BHH44_06340 [Salmonella enterica]|nr:hypothetical protein [Salmonella enterica]EBK1500153.1 hypothetical protein [Salmonella enterica subsp. enterica serovar Give]EAS2092573.1 hypothetical protein [Salmonella enterica]EAZ1006987.1 hypothetical protein [Salmonella enterica]EAZ1142939.1 hypothetical protein [Salmonella enterica]